MDTMKNSEQTATEKPNVSKGIFAELIDNVILFNGVQTVRNLSRAQGRNIFRRGLFLFSRQRDVKENKQGHPS